VDALEAVGSLKLALLTQISLRKELLPSMVRINSSIAPS